MSYEVFSQSVAPSTPAAGKSTLYFDSVTKQLYSIDDSGNVWAHLPTWITSTTANFTGTNVNTAQPVFNTTEDVITLPGTTSFHMQGCWHIETTGTNSHTIAIGFGGTATLTSIGYSCDATNAATEVLGAGSRIWIATATATVVSAALASATHHTILIDGVVRTNAGGTFIPQYTWSAAPGVAGTTLANSYLMLTPFGLNTRAAIGPWA